MGAVNSSIWELRLESKLSGADPSVTIFFA